MELPPIADISETERAVPSVRAGSRGLSIFAYSLNGRVLRAHAEGSLTTSKLEETIGWAPHTSLRAALSNLCEQGALARVEQATPSKGATELTEAGRELLEVADRLERWLEQAPAGSVELDSAAAAGALRALVGGWDSSIVRMLAEQPRSLTQLSAEISDFSYPALERRLSRLRATGLVTHVEGHGRGRYHAVTEWLRYAVAPLAAAARWEHGHMRDQAEPPSRVEVEAAFLLALPLIEVPRSASGECALSVLTVPEAGEGEREVAGVTLWLDEGRIATCASGVLPNPSTWGLGTAPAWLDAVIDGKLANLRIGGASTYIPRRIAREFHRVLFSR